MISRCIEDVRAIERFAGTGLIDLVRITLLLAGITALLFNANPRLAAIALLPTIPLMYRPSSFQTTYEGVWTGFAKNGDGSNIPPLDCTDQAAIKDLYNLKPVKK